MKEKEMFIVFSNEPYYPYLVIETNNFKEAKEKFEEHKRFTIFKDQSLYLCKVIEKYTGKKEIEK